MLKPCTVIIEFKNFGLDTDAPDIRKELFNLIKKDLEGNGAEIYAEDKEQIKVKIDTIE